MGVSDRAADEGPMIRYIIISCAYTDVVLYALSRSLH